MSNGVIEFRESEFNEINRVLDKSVSRINGTNETFSDSFKDATNVDLMTESTSKIGKQMSTIANQINKMNSTISSAYENMSHVEDTLTSKAEEINAPTDFYKNDSSRNISVNSGKMNKEDGEAINPNNQNNEKDLQFKDVLDYNDKLKHIVKEYEFNNGEIDINSDKADLKNIKKIQVTIDDSIEENSFEEQILTDITKEINEEFPEFNNNFEIKQLYLEAMKNIDTKQVEYDDLYKNVKKEILIKINKGNYVLKSFGE